VFGKDEHAPSGDLSIVECSTPLIRWKRY
jgi:hypothetical protein